jgi:hypothetical protein
VLKRIVRAVPIIDRKFDTAVMIQSTVTIPLQNLADALNAKDPAASTAAYAALTAGCTACHQAVNHGLIAIKVPQGIQCISPLEMPRLERVRLVSGG